MLKMLSKSHAFFLCKRFEIKINISRKVAKTFTKFWGDCLFWPLFINKQKKVYRVLTQYFFQKKRRKDEKRGDYLLFYEMLKKCEEKKEERRFYGISLKKRRKEDFLEKNITIHTHFSCLPLTIIIPMSKEIASFTKVGKKRRIMENL
jgi:hypothetical protein